MDMPFGKHKGTPLEDVPEDYLVWVLDNCERISPTLRRAIQQVLGLEVDEPQPRPPPGTTFNSGGSSGVPLSRVRAMVLEAVRKWHRTHAMRNHPDRGGRVEVAQAINAAGDELTREIAAVFDAAGT